MLFSICVSHAACGAYKYYKCTCGFQVSVRTSPTISPNTSRDSSRSHSSETEQYPRPPGNVDIQRFLQGPCARISQAPLCSIWEGLGLQIMFPWREDGPGREGELCPGVSRQHLALSPWGSHMRTLFSISQGREEDLPIPSSKDSDSFKLYLS